MVILLVHYEPNVNIWKIPSNCKIVQNGILGYMFAKIDQNYMNLVTFFRENISRAITISPGISRNVNLRPERSAN
jgi:hypothetical protein